MNVNKPIIKQQQHDTSPKNPYFWLFLKKIMAILAKKQRTHAPICPSSYLVIPFWPLLSGIVICDLKLESTSSSLRLLVLSTHSSLSCVTLGKLVNPLCTVFSPAI